eukprot:TRINITY_DN3497_c0_g1_i1.p1 TRINITY_DN3497_c0_g1~~TRINITY_DN3497_c0_g1_i1.p1  ORF type:complete len:106 (-),score=4.10 TRINITY_DN3497_c0_g1_i1:374-691(-)
MVALDLWEQRGSLTWALWEQQQCDLAWLLFFGVLLQIMSIFLLMCTLPCLCLRGKNKLVCLVYTLLIVDLITLIAIAVPVVGCGKPEASIITFCVFGIRTHFCDL